MVAGGGGRVVVALVGRCGAEERGSRERERVAEAGAGRKKRVRDFRTLNKPYGFGCQKNRSHWPLLAPVLLGPRPIPWLPATFWLRVLMDRGLNTSLAPVLSEPQPIPFFGFGYLENRGLKLGCNCKNAIAPLYASVPSQPRHIRRGKMRILH